MYLKTLKKWYVFQFLMGEGQGTFESQKPFPSDYFSDIFEIHVWGCVLMGIWKIWHICLRLWDITVHTRPDGDLENLAIEKCTARDLKITLLHSASHGVFDLVALTCLTS